MSDDQLALWVVGQAVYLKAHTKNTPWTLNDEVEHVIAALEEANEQLESKTR